MGTPTTPLPNYSFENMIQETYEVPKDWYSFSPKFYAAYGSSYLTKSTDAATGIFSARIENTSDAIYNIGSAFMTNGYVNNSGFHGGIPFVAIADQFSFQYKYTAVGGNLASLKLTICKDGVSEYEDSVYSISPSANWTTKTIDFSYNQTPDSVRVTFFAGVSLGSVLYVDDIQFLGGNVSVNDATPVGYEVYPNPSNLFFKIYGVNNAKIKIYSISRQIIYSNTLNTDVGLINTEEWKDGVYFIQIQKNNQITTKKVVIQH